MQGIQAIADKSVAELADQYEKVENHYYEKAQEVVDRVTQGLFDMASNRLLYEAVQQNLAVLMSTVEKVEVYRRPKPTFKSRSFKLLQLEDVSPSSKPALTEGN